MDSEEKNLHVAGVVPIRKIRLVDEAARIIRDMILTGKLSAGTRVRQVELARGMGISRTPLREALMKLEQEGLITMLPRGGLKVVELDAVGAIELYEIREVLDGLAARLAAERINTHNLKNLEQHLKKMENSMETRNTHGWFIHHVAFHEEIFQASGNSRLLGLISTVRLSIQRFHPLLLTTPNRLSNAFREHGDIFKAIRARDPEKAEALARLHIANAKEVVVEVMADRRQHVNQAEGR
ncbi:MAG: GntR family transcriptional regulator [Candidatus Binatia bacterium]